MGPLPVAGYRALGRSLPLIRVPSGRDGYVLEQESPSAHAADLQAERLQSSPQAVQPRVQ